MRRKHYTQKEKNEVSALLTAGKSYNTVHALTGVPKSTMSDWFGKTLRKSIDRKFILKHLKKIRKSAAIALKEKYEKIRSEQKELIRATIQKELPSYPLDNIGFYKSLLAMLYWAEGSKHEQAIGPKFANTDPLLARLYINLMRRCYPINEKKFSVGLYVHYYHSIKKVKKFWSETLQVPKEQFYKVYVKKRSKTKRFRKNFAGICFIYYGNSMIRKELMELGTTLGTFIVNAHVLVA